jgi:hypothetical protein
MSGLLSFGSQSERIIVLAQYGASGGPFDAIQPTLPYPLHVSKVVDSVDFALMENAAGCTIHDTQAATLAWQHRRSNLGLAGFGTFLRH